ncbi:ribosomal protein S18-alanine N-acetyltransferase [Calidifontibacillus erzurumensis]|uniref:ribosomal protein S18-alanine N-acetyltransferase n=1 Tax=Calidifontibacillus erzurumensis TaxID=2741433 RepID=UPI0035B56CBC
MEKSIHFRLMTVNDIDQVYEIEVNSFTLPWSKEAFYNEMTKNEYAKYIVMELDDKLIGYCGLWAIIDEGHITNIAVLPDYRGKKYGEALLDQVIKFSKAIGLKTLTLEVRVSNEIAQNLYKKFGFQAGGIRKNYYTDNYEDALVMWVNLDEL